MHNNNNNKSPDKKERLAHGPLAESATDVNYNNYNSEQLRGHKSRRDIVECARANGSRTRAVTSRSTDDEMFVQEMFVRTHAHKTRGELPVPHRAPNRQLGDRVELYILCNGLDAQGRTWPSESRETHKSDP